MKAMTFGIDDAGMVEVEILTGPSEHGLFVVHDGTRKLVRHRDRLQALDDEAKERLKK